VLLWSEFLFFSQRQLIFFIFLDEDFCTAHQMKNAMQVYFTFI